MNHYFDFSTQKPVEQTPIPKRATGVTANYSHNPHSLSQDEQRVYNHLLQLVQTESPSDMIERCRTLFIEGKGYPEPEILSAIDKITLSKQAQAIEEFDFFLNRCCHILINRWHMQPQLHFAIAELVTMLDSEPVGSRTTSLRYREIKRLRELVHRFIKSEQYLILRRFTQVINQNTIEGNRPAQQPLMTLIRRYPYLYEHCLMNEDSTYEQKETVRHFQAEVQKKFEIDLSHYVTYKVRRIQISQKTPQTDINRILRPVNNPTLLSDRQLYSTLKQFIGKTECGCTYNELAQKFVTYSSCANNFRDFKDGLYEYLITSVDEQYGKRQFNQRLYKHLQNTMPQADFKKTNEFLIVRTCSQLFNLLVVHNQVSPQHSTFLDLITSQGTLPTIGLLLKIVLICRKVKPYLEKKFAILFNHYESSTTDGLTWLVGTLEQLNIAMTINFGNMDLSFFKKFC